jgi:outer membrane receptor protein involved in Fe transport
VGGLYAHGPWHASLTYKQVGDAISNDAVPIRIPSYYTVNADGAYSFSRFQVKVQVFNLFDKRQIVNETGGFYTYQSGREIQLTLVGKFR